MLFFSVTANWQHITTVAVFFLNLVIQLTIYSGFLFLLRVLKVIQKWFGLIKTSLKAMFSFHTLILKWFIWVRVYKSTRLHIDLLVNIQSTNTRVFEILPKPSMKKFTFSQSSGWKLTTLLFHSSEILFPASSTFSFTVSLISKPSIQYFLKVFFNFTL